MIGGLLVTSIFSYAGGRETPNEEIDNVTSSMAVFLYFFVESYCSLVDYVSISCVCVCIELWIHIQIILL